MCKMVHVLQMALGRITAHSTVGFCCQVLNFKLSGCQKTTVAQFGLEKAFLACSLEAESISELKTVTVYNRQQER